MPYALILFGAILLVAGVRNTYGQLWTLVKGDFTGENSFLPWIAAVAVVGGLGYIPRLRPLSIAFMTLLLLVLVISNNGVFNQLQQFIKSGGSAQSPTPVTTGSAAPASLTPLAEISNNLTSLG